MEGIASIDLFVVPTIAFQPLFAFLVLGLERRRLLWFAVTRNPTADWLARQITEAFPWDGAPKYLIRDNDRVFGAVFKAHVRAMGIRDRPTSFRSPWQNGYVERLIGSIRRECTDHLLVFNAEHLRRILAKYATYYNEVRTHVSLGKDAPCRRPSNGSETLSRIQSLADYTIAMLESSFRKRQADRFRCRAPPCGPDRHHCNDHAKPARRRSRATVTRLSPPLPRPSLKPILSRGDFISISIT
jgi:transposase InsO family protein